MEEKKTFEELLKKDENVLRYIASQLERDKDDAEDLYQESLLKALLKFDTWKPTFKFNSWVQVIMLNIYRDKYRKNKGFEFNSLETDDEMSTCNLISNGEDTKIFKDIQHEELRDHINNIEMKDKLRESFDLWLAHYSYQEISDKLGAPLNTVKVRVHTAKKIIINSYKK